MKYKKVVILLTIATLGIAGCGKGTSTESKKSSATSTVTLSSSGHATVNTVDLTEGKYSDEKLDASWDEKVAVKIALDGDSATADDKNVEIDGNKITITGAGTYVLSGTLTDGQVIVDSDDKDSVRLVLNGANITCSNSSAIWIKDGDTIVTLADGTENILSDGSSYENDEDEPKATVYAKDDLTFNGTGSLTVNGNYKNAIQCKDALKFVSGTYTVTAVNNGLVGKDSVSVKDGTYTITSGGDGIKSTNTDETDKGYVMIDGGTFTITAEGDGIQAETLLRINDGDFTIQTGGGSANAVQKNDMGAGPMNGGGMGPGDAGEKPGDGQMPDNAEGEERQMPENGQMPQENGNSPENGQTPPEADMASTDGQTPPDKKELPSNEGNTQDSQTEQSSEEDTVSTKGLKSYVDLVMAGGTFQIDSCDDALHSNQNVEVQDGTYTINTGDDGMHADQKLTISGGTIDIQKSYEGIEGFDIVIDDGDIRVVASDDAVNAAGDSDSAANPEEDSDTSEKTTSDDTAESENKSEEEKGQPGQAGGPMADEDQGATMTINGGNLYINAGGDGLDANGDILITGGTQTLHGPADGGNGTLDYASECKITGGTFAAVGSNGMVQNPSEDSEQPVICQSLNSQVESGTVISVKDESGTVITEITTEKNVQWYAFSSNKLKIGKTYTICIGDNETEVTLENNYTEL